MGIQVKLTSRIPEISAELRAKAAVLVQVTAFEIQADAMESMTGGRSGRWYGNHRASAPGEPPAIDQGLLANTIGVSSVPGVDNDLAAMVVANADYAPHLEFGTSRMAPRPFFRPAFERAREGFERALRSLLP